MFTDARYYDDPGETPEISSPVMKLFEQLALPLRKRVTEIDTAIEESTKVLMAERAKLKSEVKELLRSILRDAGYIATELSTLTDRDGSDFVPEKGTKYGSVQRAHSPNREHAYLCKPTDGSAGCGWVKGRPRAVGYSDIAPLSGSAGANYFCMVCHKPIGTQAFVQS